MARGEAKKSGNRTISRWSHECRPPEPECGKKGAHWSALLDAANSWLFSISFLVGNHWGNFPQEAVSFVVRTSAEIQLER